MKTLNFENREDWLAARRGRITGSRFKDILVKRGTGKKIGFYELVAEKLGIAADDENPMARGTRLEPEAIAQFEKETGKKVDTSLVLWVRDDDENIALSPDGFIGKHEAVEVKCLASSRHIEALLLKKIPDEYYTQALQYFIVNDDINVLYFCLYDPRLLAKPFFYIEMRREDVMEEVQEYLDYQRNVLNEVNDLVNQLTF